MEQETTQPKEKTERKKRHWIRFFLKCFCLFLLLALLFVGAASYWITQTKSGQTWLMTTANKFLDADPDKPGLRFKITSLSGSLPFNFKFGLEGHDQYGLWLNAPENSFILNWRELPGKIHLSELKIANADLSRLPQTTEEQETAPPAKPFTLRDFQQLLEEAGAFLYERHWWLPDLAIDGTGLEKFTLPADLLAPGDTSGNRPEIDADLKLYFVNQQISLKGSVLATGNSRQSLTLPSLKLDSAHLNLEADLKPDPENEKLNAKASLNFMADRPELEIKGYPENLLGEKLALNLALKGDAYTNPSAKAASFSLAGPEISAGVLSGNGSLDWTSGSEWQAARMDGKTSLRLGLDYRPVAQAWLKNNPDSSLAMLPEPVKIVLHSSGELPKTNLEFDLSSNGIEVEGHEIANLHLLAKGDDLVLPLDGNAMRELLKEHSVDIAFSAEAEKIPVSLVTQAYFQGLTDAEPEKETKISTWLAGLRKLALTGAGISCQGQLAANIMEGAMPAIDGKIHVNIDNWQTINKFLPGMELSGKTSLALELQNQPSSLTGANMREPAGSSGTLANFQNLNAQIDIPELNLNMGQDKYSIRKLHIKAALADLFGNLGLDSQMELASIEALDMKIGADLKANGRLSGPINVLLNTSGNLSSKIDASWSPGEALLRSFKADLVLPANLSPSGKAAKLALQSRNPVQAHYGEKGIGLQGLDLNIQPSGRLKADANLSADKLDCKISLENLNLKPWQALLPQIPAGSASLEARLSGTPKRPAGNFNLGINKLIIPGASLPPLSLALKGDVLNRGAASALQLNMTIDPSTLKALGGSTGNISASIPLIFGNDGIPRPDMEGNLAAKVRWDGALGPLWNLAPVADMRLNGRLNINIDADGHLKTPRIKGGINISKARFEEIALGVLLTDINLKLDLKDRLAGMPAPQKGALDSLPGGAVLAFSASDGRGGTITMDGQAALSGEKIDIKTKIDHLKPLRRRDIHIELSGEATAVGSALAPQIAGEIIVNQGEVLLNNIEMTGSVTTLPITEPGSKKEKASPEVQAATQEGSGSLNVRIRMLPRFTVEGRGLTSIWQANLLIEGTPANPRITGNISSVKGNFDFLGKNFALTKGIVFFGGGQISNPLLDIELTNETPDLTAHLLVTGPVSKIKLSMTSDPSLPRDEILSRVLFGRSVGDLSRMEALQLAGAVAQLAGFGGGTGILGMAKKALGVDVLRLGTSASDAAGEPGDQTAGGTTIEMGKYINDMIYLGVQQGMQPDSTAFIIQLELSPRTNLEIRTEQNNTWGGLQWKYNY